MIVKSIIFLVFAFLGLIVFPLAVASHIHLYADGAYFFTRLIETANTSSAGYSFCRIFAHFVTQLPMLWVLKAGVFDVADLSYVYGASLFFSPLICNLVAVCIFLRKKMLVRAVLLSFMYLISVLFTSWFIISEAHLAVGFFVLAIAMIVAGNTQKLSKLVILFLLGVLSFSCYEFWAFFFPVCLVLFLAAIKGQGKVPLSIRAFQRLIILLYIGGFIFNTVGIILFDNGDNRNLMFTGHIQSVFFPAILIILIFVSVLYLGYLDPVIFKSFRRGKDEASKPKAKNHAYQLGFLNVLVFVAIAMLALIITPYFIDLLKPNKAYPLRGLNLVLPLLFALSFVFRSKKDLDFIRSHMIAFFFLVPLLIFTLRAYPYNIEKWLVFKKSFFNVTRRNSGYVNVNELGIDNSFFLWRWTSPALSIIFQSIDGRSVKSILYNPDSDLQPYGPDHSKDAENLVKKMNSELVAGLRIR